MAMKITAQVMGGQPKVFDDVETVKDIKAKLGVSNHTATVNGEPASDDQELSDYEFVTLAPAVKGA